MADKPARPSLPALLGDGLLLVCAVLGLSGCFLSLYGAGAAEWNGYQTTALDLCAARGWELAAWAALFALAALCVWSLPRLRPAAAGGLAALWGAAAFLLRRQLFQGAGITLRIVSQMFSQRVGGDSFAFPTEAAMEEEGRAVWLFLVLSLALLSLALGWAVVRTRRWWLAVLLTLPPLLPGLLADLYPHWPSLLALACCWCAMLLCDLCKWSAPDRRGLLTLAAVPLAGLALVGLTLLLPREGYTRPPWALQAEAELYRAGDRLSQFFSRWEGPFSGAAGYVGPTAEADLTRAGPPRYTGRTVLRVNTSYTGQIYLRGAALGRYENGRWTDPGEAVYQEYLDDLERAMVKDAPSPLLFPSLCTQVMSLAGQDPGASLVYSAAYTATVENVRGSGVYAPYQLLDQDWQEAGLTLVRDSYVACGPGQARYTLTFAPPVDEPAVSGPLAQRYYRLYAARQFLAVPEELADELEELCRSQGLLSSGDAYALAPLWAAQQVAQVLERLCRYDLDTPAPPAGEDPVRYFLTEGRRGYCMHFASAAALMLRAMGVPARYVSGYAVDVQSGAWTQVPDRAAHAWVEVYVDGYGWYPVEVTPAAAFDWARPSEELPSPSPSQPLPESGEPTPEPTPTPAPTPTPQPEDPSAPPAPSAEVLGDGEAPEWELDLSFLVPWLKALAGGAGALALFWLWQRLLKGARARRLDGPDRNRAALDCYGYLLGLKPWGGRMDGEALELARKARFSQHTLTREELGVLRAQLDGERTRLGRELPLLRRLAFRYWWGLPKTGKNTGKSSENPG